MTNILFILAFVLLILLSIIISGFLISLYWKWFVMPIFGLKPITISQGLGLSLFINMVTSQINFNSASTNKPDLIEGISKVFFYYLSYFAVGYILHFFIRKRDTK